MKIRKIIDMCNDDKLKNTLDINCLIWCIQMVDVLLQFVKERNLIDIDNYTMENNL
jgi:hypothetical protein